MRPLYRLFIVVGALSLAALVPAGEASAQDCEPDPVSGGRCPVKPNPPTTTQTYCDWECEEAKARAREERRKAREAKRQRKEWDRQARENRKRNEARATLVERANAFVIESQRAHERGDYGRQMELLRKALAVMPDDPTLRMNVVNHLSFHGRNGIWRDQQLADYSRMAAHQRTADEIRILLAGDMSSAVGYAQKKGEADSFLSDFEYSYKPEAARQARERQIADEQNRLARGGQSGVELNPGARAAQAGGGIDLARRRLPPPLGASALEQLRQVVESRATVGEVLEGGQTYADPERFGRPVDPLPVLSREQQARLSADPGFRQLSRETADAEAEFARATKEFAGLRRVRELARAGSSDVPTEADIARAEKAARDRARKLEAARAKERKAINRIMGEPIYRED